MEEPLITLLIGLVVIFGILLLFWPKGGLFGYFRRLRQMSDRILQEDALKQMHKCERHNQQPTLETLAGALQISVNRAADLVTKMQRSDLIEIKGQELQLTPQGRRYALQIIRSHRLWERYLAQETGYREGEWHDQADWLEHQTPPEETDALDIRLGRPTHDPHGDPIPTAEGELVTHGGEPLPAMPLDKTLQIVHIEDEPEAVYAQLLAEDLHLGMQVRLLESTPQRVRFWANGDEHLLAPIVAANISVVEVPVEMPAKTRQGALLSSLDAGQGGTVIELSPRMRGSERRRMMDLGILPGTEIYAEMSAPGGDPTAYRVRGALIALRSEQAEMIKIEKTTEDTE